MIRHDIFADKVKTTLVRAGLPVASTFDDTLSCGVYVEIVDDEQLPPEAFLKWRVHPVLQEHFRTVPHDALLSDPQVREMRVAQEAMNTAVIAVLENAGFSARPVRGERVGEILVGESAG
ncbi:hypothetical protein M2164_002838 [Streptomyces sp. SAI-208]|uniref:hypothetical protein n=1 Tax=unclassified Streptomyces TaxID=2593676 RepID=UPI002475E62F|nr:MULTISPECIES: hypothetical protein [unclassified Streptomyces]MDH6516399.1 hypothetical protein [Streptomyces sp. SAI-090]MDH6548593.1 hypothetical protein [Streptomyces sp. SAI-041]MDH6567686.1 hypothetical protein [Streptomyces sp. SAI-117]MDH6587385.1 hypothetical protein [Streptomyces sp. SAI-133]MDH6607203.1 hypothetical protein [Streptomyces sp. SAI-208]